MATLLACLEAYQAWHDSMPASLIETALAEHLDAVLGLREQVDALEAAELPKGFGCEG